MICNFLLFYVDQRTPAAVYIASVSAIPPTFRICLPYYSGDGFQTYCAAVISNKKKSRRVELRWFRLNFIKCIMLQRSEQQKNYANGSSRADSNRIL